MNTTESSAIHTALRTINSTLQSHRTTMQNQNTALSSHNTTLTIVILMSAAAMLMSAAALKKSLRVLEYQRNKDAMKDVKDGNDIKAQPKAARIANRRASFAILAEANEKIPVLLDIPATMRFISIEPMLEPIKLGRFLNAGYSLGEWTSRNYLDWVIVGGETGANARAMNPDWARRVRDQCKSAAVPFFFKKFGGRQTTPEDLMIREFPKKGKR